MNHHDPPLPENLRVKTRLHRGLLRELPQRLYAHTSSPTPSVIPFHHGWRHLGATPANRTCTTNAHELGEARTHRQHILENVHEHPYPEENHPSRSRSNTTACCLPQPIDAHDNHTSARSLEGAAAPADQLRLRQDARSHHVQRFPRQKSKRHEAVLLSTKAGEQVIHPEHQIRPAQISLRIESLHAGAHGATGPRAALRQPATLARQPPPGLAVRVHAACKRQML
ncbi:hypothetical protein DM02DRAFT_678558 [Periconia macrospinosa]|uniref:Uncharacterized protein n=1 Tax=Periconia macrospinosa TaxID=97972 RepID=A0A2V1CXQ9_9PLEO|nr:hypothetical protein DM02DRAFT_678558 [Periconia macrospinosa]